MSAPSVSHPGQPLRPDSQKSSYAGMLLVLSVVSGCASGMDPAVEELAWQGPDAVEATDVEVAFFDRVSEPGHGRFVLNGESVELQYERVGGLAVLEGDIILGELAELSPAQLGATNVAQGAAYRSKEFWPNATVPYAFDASVSEDVREAFLAGAEAWSEEVWSLKFVERTTEDDYLEVVSDHGNSAVPGHSGGPQMLSLTSTSPGVAAHEIGHALGLLHEQARADRDEHITVLTENIWPGKEHNFSKYGNVGTAAFSDVGAYNLNSIMHYGSYYFSDTGDPTILTVDGELVDANRSYIAETDADAIEFLAYRSRINLPKWTEVLAPAASMPLGTELRAGTQGRFLVRLSEEGNLEFHDLHGPGLLWESETAGMGVTELLMQDDGILALRAGEETVWDVRSGASPGSSFWLGYGVVGVGNENQGLTWASIWGN